MDERLIIISDTREQLPWLFPENLVINCRGTLKTGDYALQGDEEHFAIERKALGDFLGTISTGWERFLREIGRMDKFVCKVIIIEGDFSSCCFSEKGGLIVAPQHNHPMVTPAFICSRVATLTLMGVSVLFAGSASEACALAYQIFKKRKQEINDNGNNS